MIADEVQPAAQSRWVWRQFARLKNLAFGTLLALSPPTSLLLLGWLMRQTRSAALARAGLPAESVGWVLGARGSGFIRRMFGGLAQNVREGILAAIALLFATLPFSSIWLLSWWAGWENSFSKGYEQAFVGPSLGLFGVATFMAIMVHLPMALAHQAVQSRGFALFELRRVRSAMRHSGWGYLFLAFTTVFFALPIFASRGLIALAYDIVPGLDNYSPDEIQSLTFVISLVTGAYIVVSLAILRRWSGRIYAAAVLRAKAGTDEHLWAKSPLAAAPDTEYRRSFATRMIRFVLLLIVWFVLAAQIYIAQFLNHDWHVWLTHPYWFLPWVM